VYPYNSGGNDYPLCLSILIQVLLLREPLETPVGFPEVPGRKSLIHCNVKNYEKAIFSMG
jgi:hypothetical protein